MKGTNTVVATSSSPPTSFSPSAPPPSFPNTAVAETQEAEELELGVMPQPSAHENNYRKNNCEAQHSSLDGNNNNNKVGVSEEEEDDDDDDDEEEEVVEWEDFMANYWKSIGNNNTNASSPSPPVQSNAILAMEDTDMKPCEIEPDLDEELNALSAIRTGCMDIDMDFNDDNGNDNDDSANEKITLVRSSNNDDAGMNQLSMIGLECSRAMANIVVAIVNDSGGNTSDRKKKNGMEGLRIDVGALLAGGVIGTRHDSNNTRISPSKRNTIIDLEHGSNGTTSPSSPSSPNTNQPMNTTVSLGQKLEFHTSEASSMQPLPTMASVAPQYACQQTTTLQQHPLDADLVKLISAAATVVDIDDNASVGKKSTKSSTTGASEGGGGGMASSTNWKIKTSPLPKPELIRATGPILTRTSLRSLVMKKWHPSYWMQYGTHELLIFRSKDHMDDWRYNPYHGKKQRDFLVKLHIDFMADMVPPASDAAASTGAEGGGSKGSSSGTKEGILGHRILPVKKKSYGKNEEEMYQFKLERWTNLGCSVLAAFASQDEDEVQILHASICEILKRCPNNGLRNIDHMLK